MLTIKERETLDQPPENPSPLPKAVVKVDSPSCSLTNMASGVLSYLRETFFPRIAKVSSHREISKKLVRELEQFIEPQYIRRWLDTPNPTLDGSTPQTILDRGEEWRIHEVIGRLKSGDYH